MPFPISKPTSTRNLINTMKYVLYLKNDPNQEVINSVTDNYLENIELAIKYFAGIKKLDLENFNQIYEVKKCRNQNH